MSSSRSQRSSLSALTRYAMVAVSAMYERCVRSVRIAFLSMPGLSNETYGRDNS